MKKSNLLVIIPVFLCLLGKSQAKTTEEDQQTWVGYFNQTRFSNKFGTWTDLHARAGDHFTGRMTQAIARVGLTYYLRDDVKLTAGYAFVNHYPAEGHRNVSQPEHRVWQQLQWHSRYDRLRLMQWFRLEQRFRRKIVDDFTLGSGSNFNYRFRYNFFAQLPLSPRRFKPNTLSLVLNDELHINFGKKIVYNYFDQNRFFLGFNYHVNTHDNIQFGYMNVFQQLSSGNVYRNNHVVRLFYFHNLDLRSKKV